MKLRDFELKEPTILPFDCEQAVVLDRIFSYYTGKSLAERQEGVALIEELVHNIYKTGREDGEEYASQLLAEQGYCEMCWTYHRRLIKNCTSDHK